jgi:regulatory protein
MPSRISALRTGRNGRMVTVELDGKESVRLSAAAVSGLQPGQALSPEQVERLRRESRLEDSYARCLALLARRPRSRTELERYLRGRKLSDAEREAVLERLVGRGWIDDGKFARLWVENRQEFRPRSGRALRMELRRFGVPDDDIREALRDVDEAAAALSAARKKAPRLTRTVGKGPQARILFQRKMAAHLASRGFDYDLSRETALAVWTESLAALCDGESLADPGEGGCSGGEYE